MSNKQVQEQTRGGSPGHRPSGKSARRAAAQRAAAERAAAQRAAARRRRNMIIVAASVLTVVVAASAVTLILVLTGSKPKHTSTAPATSASASAEPAAFPSLPAGADPALKTKPTVTAGTGNLTKLNVTTLVQGTGAAVKSGQTITVNYVGVTYKDGKEFDSSWSSQKTVDFPIGVGQVIPGWDQGLVGVKVGSRVQLDIPSNLAYGDTSSNGSPTGPLRFVVDVLAAK